MCKVLFFIVIQVKPYLKQKFLTHQSSSFLLIQEMFIGFHHPLNLKKNFKLLFFGRLKRLPYFHVLLSKCKDLKSAPCFLSSPRGLILVANWLFSCQPSYVIHCHFWLTHPSVSPFQTPFTSGQENKEIFLQTARLIAGSSYHYKNLDLPYGPTWCYCVVFYWIILHHIALHSIELYWIVLIYFCFCFLL